MSDSGNIDGADSSVNARTGSRGTVLASMARSVLAGAEASGLSRAALLERSGISAALLNDPEGRVLQPAYMRLWEEIEQSTKDPFFGLHFAESQVEAATFSVVGFVAKSSKTFGDGVRRFVRYSRLINETEEISLTPDGDTWLIRQNPREVGPPWPRHKTESALANYILRGRAWTGRVWSPISVSFVHPRPKDTSEHQRIFGCLLRFEQPRNEIRIDASILDLPMQNSSMDLVDYLSRRADSLMSAMQPGDLLDDVRRAIRSTLPDGTPELSTVAKSLGLSTRSLQRRLAEADTTFARLVDETRHTLALDLLADRRVSVEEAGFLLGFADSRGFRRAFERWTGSSPRTYRTGGTALAR